MKMKLFVLLILAVFASEDNENDTENNAKNETRIGNNEKVVVKIEEDVCAKMNKKSTHIGVFYDKDKLKWRAQRWSKNENKKFYNGYYDGEQTAAHASDTLAKKLMENSKHNYRLNFPDEEIEVYPEKSSKYIGLTYVKRESKWSTQRWSKSEKRRVFNGNYDNEETAAHASDTLARKLMENGEQKLKLNFPDDHTEVYGKKSSKYIGVSYCENKSKWRAQRYSKYENKKFSNGYYNDEETAAYASDALARHLMENSEQKFKLNFPDDNTEVYPAGNQKKRKRQNEITREHPQNN